MFTKIVFGKTTITVPFSSKKAANAFVRGFNEYVRLSIQDKEYPCRNEEEQRGSRFAETISRYCEQNGLRLQSHRIEVIEDQENQQSLFDVFE
jgi:hypothetical protein